MRPHQERETLRQVTVLNNSFDKILRGVGRKEHTRLHTRTLTRAHTHRQVSFTKAAFRCKHRSRASSEALPLDALERHVATKTLVFQSITYKPARDRRHSTRKFWWPSSELAPDS